MQRILALLAHIGYTARRYKFLSARLDDLAMAALSALPIYVGWRGWRQGFGLAHGLAIAACLVLLSALVFLRLRRYLLFQAAGCDIPANEAPLRPEEKIQCRATGYLQVNDMRRHFIELPALLWITELGEYILMARVQVRSFPFLIAPTEEEGMWYAFFRPTDLFSPDAGYLWFGWSRRQAIRLRYRDPAGNPTTAYLSFDRPEDQRRLVSEFATRAGTQRAP